MICYSAVMTDQSYRLMVLLGFMPKEIECRRCGQPAPFRDDQMAARYECASGHAAAAMWSDPCVVGREDTADQYYRGAAAENRPTGF